MLENKRIIFVMSGLDMGGAERQALCLARHLVGIGAKVEMWGFAKPGRASAVCDELGIGWRIVPFAWTRNPLRRAKSLARVAMALRRARPDVILPYTTWPNVACGLTWRLSGAKSCIWNQRDVRVQPGPNKLGAASRRLAIWQTPLFVSNSAHGAEFLMNHYGAPAGRIRLIHNGVELGVPETLPAKWRKDLGIADGSFVACMLGNLHQFKDHATLLKAWRLVVDRLRPQGASPTLVLAGKASKTHDSLKVLADELKLGKSVLFIGQVKDVAGLLGAVDIGVFSSKEEGCPNGVLECMAAGLPVVATDIPGVREAVGAEGLPWLTPVGDDEAMADRVVSLATSSQERQRLGVANRQRIHDAFAPHRMCREMTELIVQSIGVRS